MIDNEWKEHLREMDDLRSAVNNAQYEQKDQVDLSGKKEAGKSKGILRQL